ncbi:Uncharacterised protein [Pseudomonas luteola]|uniref:XRE family transcriptional regulator n=1 Tax=Pseudomonas luteola TaxID=47886 RepID=A0A2X2BYU1_PSELU|nr:MULTISPECIES: hypothetical protein [Pseudomonas]MBA1250213.1 hypothetical protein [Pseudomonas zeshuii]MBH3441736.1 hypothetical protein [Pseudomonas luteola]SPY99931.1 Uncharacterised protein [Pseudomonas luteola]
MQTAQMTPLEVKSFIKQKGWTGRALAARWGKSETWVSKIINNPERDLAWDDAIRGLPKMLVPRSPSRNQSAWKGMK